MCNNKNCKRCHGKTECKPQKCKTSNCKPKCDKVLVKYKFKDHYASEVLEDFNSNVFGTDGTLSIDAEGLLVVANPFTATVPLGNEHAKHLRYWNESFCLSDDYEIYYESKVAVQQYIPVDEIPSQFLPRLRNINEDIRLCSGAINALDPVTWIVCDMFLSNEKVYCFVERLPFGKTVQNDYAAYSNCVEAVCRAGDPYNDFIKIAMGFKKNSVNFYVNDKLVFTVPRYGVRQLDSYRLLDHQGVAKIVEVNDIYLGFGLFSLLDMQLPNNYARQLVVDDFGDNQAASGLVQLDNTATYGETLPSQLTGDNRPIVDANVTWAVQLNDFPNDNHDIKLFGQGAALRMKYFKVEKKYCKQ